MKEMGTVLHAVAVLFGCLVLTGILMLIPVLTTCAFFLGWKFSGTLLMLSVIEFRSYVWAFKIDLSNDLRYKNGKRVDRRHSNAFIWRNA